MGEKWELMVGVLVKSIKNQVIEVEKACQEVEKEQIIKKQK